MSVEPLAAVELLAPSSYQEMADLVRDAEASGRPLVPSGLGNHLALTGPLPPGAAVLSSRRLHRVLRYEPGDFTIGVQAGIPLDALKAVLAENGQEIPVDFPSSPRGTIGGALAQARHGPRRGRFGTFRPYLIGVAGLRGGGRTYKAGGMVVKNVAGYDVMKLILGSGGTLGVILEANFKLRPLAAARSARRAGFASAGEAWALARKIREGALEPSVLCVLNPPAGSGLAATLGSPSEAAWTVFWSFEGNAGAVDWLEAEVDRLLRESAAAEVRAVERSMAAVALDFLTRASEVEPADRPRTLLLSLSALVTDGPEAGPALLRALDEAGGSRASPAAAGAVWLISDVSSGLHLARWELAGPAEGLAEAAESAREAAAGVARRFGGSGRVLAWPAALGGPVEPALVAERDPSLGARMRQVFDPQGVFRPVAAAPGAGGGSR